MTNKVIVKLIVPKLDLKIDMFIPVNESIYNVKKSMIKVIPELNHLSDNDLDKYILLNKNTSKIYLNKEIVITTDIRNATELFLLEKK